MLIKKYGARFNKGLKIINLRDILLLSFYLVAVVFTAFQLLDSEFYQLWKITRTLFSVYSSLSRMDLQLRGGLQVYTDRFVLANTLMYSETYSDILTPAQQAQRLLESQKAYDCTILLLNSSKVFTFLIQDVGTKKTDLGKAITNFQMNELLVDLPDKLREIVLKTRLLNRIYIGSSRQTRAEIFISGITFLGVFKVTLETFEKNLLTLQPTLALKRPPYNALLSDLKINFAEPSDTRFGTLRNTWRESLDFHNSTLITLKNLVIQEQPQETSKMLLIYNLIFLFLYLVFIGGAIYLSREIKWWLFDLLSQYKNLRKEEVGMHKLILSHRLWFFQKFRLDEPMMINNYVKVNFSSQNHDTVKILKSDKSETGKKLPHQTKRVLNKMRFNIVFKSTATMLTATFLSVSLVCYFISVLVLNNKSFDTAHELMLFYTGTYEKLSESYHFYLCHSMFLAFGNFIRISGILPSIYIKDFAETTPMLKMIQHFVNQRSNLLEFFGSERGESIDTMIFTNICSELDKTKITYESDYRICTGNSYASKGLVQFMYNQREMLEEIRNLVFSNQDFVKNSESDWLIFPFSDYMYTPSKMSFRMASKIVFETVFENILPAGEVSINKELEKLENSIYYLNRLTPPILISIFALFYLFVILKTLIDDLKMCAESLFNMLPEIMVQNKIIYRKFNETYSVKY